MVVRPNVHGFILFIAASVLTIAATEVMEATGVYLAWQFTLPFLLGLLYRIASRGPTWSQIVQSALPWAAFLLYWYPSASGSRDGEAVGLLFGITAYLAVSTIVVTTVLIAIGYAVAHWKAKHVINDA